MSPWFLIVPLIGLIATVAQIWSILRDVRQEEREPSHALPTITNEDSPQLELSPQQHILLLNERLNELNRHLLAMRDTLTKLARQPVLSGQGEATNLEEST